MEAFMAYCKNCGQMIDDKAVICPKCGVQQQTIVASDDTGSFGWGLLGFCLPVVGLILFLVWKDSRPKNSKIAGKGALISVILLIVVYIAMIALGIGFAGFSNL